jgi:hypothetical protein
MPFDTMDEQLAARATRRRVVKTGVKLAYAVPVIATTFKLQQGYAAAQSPACIGGKCGDLPECSPDGECFCFDDGQDGGFCHRCQRCDSVVAAGLLCPDGKCPSGYLCSTLSCCVDDDGNPLAVCLQPCAGTTSDCFADAGIQSLAARPLTTVG